MRRRYRGLGAGPSEVEVLAITTRDHYVGALERAKSARALPAVGAIVLACRAATEDLLRARYLHGRLTVAADAAGRPIASTDRPAEATAAVMACWDRAVAIAANPLKAMSPW